MTETTREVARKTAVESCVEYIPFAEQKAITLSIAMVKRFLTHPTKSGKMPTDDDVMKFIMLCKSQELNPWTGDAYLLGYDAHDGPQFSMITAVQALFKRAEANVNFDGMEQGVIVVKQKGDDAEPEYRAGDLVLPGENLVGGWARVYRKDREVPFFDALKLGTFNTGRSQWKKDPAGMIVKCAEASVLRKAFPTQLGGLYHDAEMQHVTEPARPNTLQAVTSQILGASTVVEEADESASGIEQNGNRFMRIGDEPPGDWAQRLRDAIADGDEESMTLIAEAIQTCANEGSLSEDELLDMEGRWKTRIALLQGAE